MLLAEAPPIKHINVFKPLPWQVAPWRDTSLVMLLTGSSGGGKSRLCAEKLHSFCLKYPGSTGLALRKVRSVMSNSTILFLRTQVIGNDPNVRHKPSEFRFEYNNGSILAYGGMKDDEQREYIRSIGVNGGVDIAWMEEATQFTEEDFNEVLGRMRGRAAPWRQIMLSTNPDAPGHWINIRLILGKEASVYFSQAEDNRYNPDNYVSDTLRTLTGVQRDRLVLGKWSVGSGRVMDTWFDDYNPVAKTGTGNVVEAADYIPDGGRVFWAIDDGYAGKIDRRTRMFASKSHPRAILLAQERDNGQLAVFAEHLAIETLAPDHLVIVRKMCEDNGWPITPSYVVRDKAAASLAGALHDAQPRLRERFSAPTVEESVKELRAWLAADANGFRRIIVHPRCFYTRYQMQTYSYGESGNIIKDHDDAIDSLRYLVWDLAHGKNPDVDVVTISSLRGWNG